jgi:hypothetical protein
VATRVISADERELIKAELNLRARARVKHERRERGICAGCAGPLSQRTANCQHCRKRHEFRRRAAKR